MPIKLEVNKRQYVFDGDGQMPLLWYLRDQLGLKGTKYGCGLGICGACIVHLNGEAIQSCTLPMDSLSENDQVTSIEGLASDEVLHPVQQVWLDMNVGQCGYCQTGQIMAAVALLNETPHPSDKEIRVAMQGNICRCGSYDRILKAIGSVSMIRNHLG